MDIELPVWAVYIVSGLFFGMGLAGISYGIFSTSWDPNRYTCRQMTSHV